MLKKKRIDLTELNQELDQYLYKGYDLFFIHGWFCSYISAPSDSEEDLVLPTYLILDEDKVTDEQKFAKLVDKLIALYSELSDNIFEKNKLLKPLINLNEPNKFDPQDLPTEAKQNLLIWLYGYLTCYLVTSADVNEYISDQNLLDNKFYPALFTLNILLVKLSQEVTLDFLANNVREDFNELLSDIKQMWESDDENVVVEDLFAKMSSDSDFNDIVSALNDVFYVIRISDENRFTKQNNTILNKLNTRH